MRELIAGTGAAYSGSALSRFYLYAKPVSWLKATLAPTSERLSLTAARASEKVRRWPLVGDRLFTKLTDLEVRLTLYAAPLGNGSVRVEITREQAVQLWPGWGEDNK